MSVKVVGIDIGTARVVGVGRTCWAYQRVTQPGLRHGFGGILSKVASLESIDVNFSSI